MIKKVIVTLTIIITFIALITPKALAGEAIIDIPDSKRDPGESFNQLLDGEATVTSDDEGSSTQSQVVGIGISESQSATLVGGFVSVAGIIPHMISRLLSAVALGDKANMEDNAQISQFFTIGDLLTNKYPLFNINIFEETPTIKELTKWIKESELDIKRWFNTRGLKYKVLNLKEKLSNMSDREKIELLASDGMLIKRPVLVSDKGIFIGFNEDKWNILK